MDFIDLTVDSRLQDSRTELSSITIFQIELESESQDCEQRR